MENDTLRDDHKFIVVADRIAETLSKRLDKHFESAARAASKVNQYGGKGVIKFGSTPNEVRTGVRDELTLVDWSSPTGLPEAVTIEMGVLTSGGVGTFPQGALLGVPVSYRAQGFVLVGTPATIMDPWTFDIARGRRFMISCSYIAVTAFSLAPPPGYVAGSLGVYGAIGPGGSFSGSESLYNTQYVDALQPNETRNILIPNRAVTIEDIVTTSVSSLAINILDASGRVLRTINSTQVGTRANGISLSGDALYVQLTNNGATALNPEVLFGLLL